jgi:nucleotide-binding universal stress UspA family protein
MILPKTILVATDFSEPADAAVAYAVALAEKLDAKLYLLNAITIPIYGIADIGIAVAASTIDALVAENQKALDATIKKYAPAKIEPLLRTGDARELIVQTAVDVGAELIVTGTHGRRGLKRALLGSVAEAVLRHAHCPVLAIRDLGN